MASIRNSNSKKGLLEHRKPVRHLYSCLHVELLWFCRCTFLSKPGMENNIYTLTYACSEGKKGVAFYIFVSGPFADTDYSCSEVD